MSEYALYLVRSSVCLGLLYVIYMVVLGRVNRPALRRWVLMISASLSLVMPLVQVPPILPERSLVPCISQALPQYLPR